MLAAGLQRQNARHLPAAKPTAAADLQRPAAAPIGAVTTCNQTKSKNNMSTLPIHITPDGIEISWKLRELIRKKILGLSRFSGGISRAEIVLREKPGSNGLFCISGRLASPGGDVRANVVHENFYSALDQLVARLRKLSMHKIVGHKLRRRVEKGAHAVVRPTSEPKEEEGEWHREDQQADARKNPHPESLQPDQKR